MADTDTQYATEGDTVTMPDGSQQVLRNGQWEPHSPVTGTGLLKAAGSGVSQMGAAIAGLPRTLQDVGKAGAGWVSALGQRPNAADQQLGTNQPPPAPAPATQPTPVAGKVPQQQDDLIPEAYSAENIAKKLPLGTYKAQNPAESAVQTATPLVLGAMGAPEVLAARTPGMLARNTAFSLARNAAAPTAAIETARGTMGNNPAEPYVEMAGALASPAAVGRAITPIRAMPSVAGTVLRDQGVNLKPSQYFDRSTGAVPSASTEGKLANTFGSGTSAGGINAAQTGEFTRGTLRTAFGNMNDPQINNALQLVQPGGGINAPTVLNRIDSNIDSAFNRATQYGLPITPGTSGAMNQVVANFRTNNPTLTAEGDQLEQTVNNITAAGHLPGRAYQNTRSTLSGLSAGDNPNVNRAYSELTDVLDRRMRGQILQTNPQDAGLFDQARDWSRSSMIIKDALKGGGASVNAQLTPDSLQRSAQKILGATNPEYLNQTHPLAQFGRAGQQAMQPLPNEAAPASALGSAIKSGVGLGAWLGAESLGQGSHVGPMLEYGAGMAGLGAAKDIGNSAAARAYHSPALQNYWLNEALRGHTGPIRNAIPESAIISALNKPGKQPEQQ